MPHIAENFLFMDRCPHCRVATPLLVEIMQATTGSASGKPTRKWRGYACTRCGGVVMAATYEKTNGILQIFPDVSALDEAIPDKAREYLRQALDSVDTPAGSVMLSASAIDAMLKAKSYKDGTLYSRIQKAAEDHFITVEMAKWAHEVRLDANEQRHADVETPLPTKDDAKRSVEFAMALAQFLFVLPSRVEQGLSQAKDNSNAEKL